MKKSILSIAIAIVISFTSFAQSPEAFKYQAVTRDLSGNILANQSVSFQISILQGSSSGSSVYTETHSGTTNAFGLINLEIGNGTVVSGDFTIISWGSDLYFVKIEMDETGGTNYQLMGTSQLLSVPYSLNAKTADNVFSGNYNDLSNQPVIPANTSDLTNDNGFITNADDADADSTNELQSLSFSNDTLSLLNGGSVVLPYDSALWTKANDTTINYNNVTINKVNSSSAEYNMRISQYINPYKALEIGRGVNGIRFDFGTAHESITAFTTGSKQFYIGTADSNNVNLKTLNQTRMTITGSGKVGIGTTSPSATFTVAGIAHFTQYAVPAFGEGLEIGYLPATGGVITSFDRDTPAWKDLYINGDNVYIGTNSGVSKQLSITSNGIGISTSSPQRSLHINNVMRLEPRSSAPSSPGAGDIYFDSTLNKLMVYDGTTWQACW